MDKDNIKLFGKTVKSGKSDPYVVFQLENQKSKSNILPNTRNPVWSETFWLRVQYPEYSKLKLEVLDDDGEDQKSQNFSINKDDFLGSYEIDVKNFTDGKLVKNKVVDLKNEKNQGKICMDLKYLRLVDFTECHTSESQATITSVTLERLENTPVEFLKKHSCLNMKVGDQKACPFYTKTFWLHAEERTLVDMILNQNFFFNDGIPAQNFIDKKITIFDSSWSLLAEGYLQTYFSVLEKQGNGYLKVKLVSAEKNTYFQEIYAKLAVRVKRAIEI